MLGRPLIQRQGMTVPAFGPGPYLDQKSLVGNATAAGVTLGIADIFGGILNRTNGGGAGFTDTWPDADTIIAALDNPQVGDSWVLLYRNAVAFAMTFAAGTGIVSGTGTLNIAASSSRWYLHTVLSNKRTVIIPGSTANGTAVLGGFSNSDIAKVMPGMGVTGTNVGASAVVLGVTPSDTPGNATITVSVNSTGTTRCLRASHLLSSREFSWMLSG
jgi:hypothetical protein